MHCIGRIGGLERGPLGPPLGFGGNTPKKFFFPQETCRIFSSFFMLHLFSCPLLGRFFGTWFFANVFLFPVKELRLLTNPSHWVMVLDAAGSYIYIVL
jgi:hypothetical protein